MFLVFRVIVVHKVENEKVFVSTCIYSKQSKKKKKQINKKFFSYP